MSSVFSFMIKMCQEIDFNLLLEYFKKLRYTEYETLNLFCD